MFIETITTLEIEMEIDAMTSPTLSIALSYSKALRWTIK